MRAVSAALAAVAALGLAARARPADGPAPAVPVLRVDPNTAPRGVLLALPRLGPALTGRVIAARRVAPFRSPEDLGRRVKGIGPATVAALRPHLRLGTDPAPSPDPAR